MFWKWVKRSGTVVVMGLPAWAVLVGLWQYQPSSLLVHVGEPGVRVCVGDLEFEADNEAWSVGPIELQPGRYELRVIRGQDTLLSYPVTLLQGHHKEVWAHWNISEPAQPGQNATADSAPPPGVTPDAPSHKGMG